MPKEIKLSKEEEIEAILTEAMQHGIAFVEDDYLDGGWEVGEVYNPIVDQQTCISFLRERLTQLSKKS